MSAPDPLLSFVGIGIPPFSIRRARQSLGLVPAGVRLRRDIDGELRNVARARFRKYTTTITAADQQPPALDGQWGGALVLVHCAVELGVEGTIEEPTEPSTGESPFDRPHVPGSIRHESGFTFYRPILLMRVADFTINRDDWGAIVDWSLTLDEV